MRMVVRISGIVFSVLSVLFLVVYPQDETLKVSESIHRLHKVAQKAPRKKVAIKEDRFRQAAQTHQGLLYILLLAFLAGILTSMTPCVYPLIPITIGILQAHGAQSLVHNLFSAIFYVLGISFVYASLGYFAATTAVIFGQWTVNPFVVGLLILFFLYLAFSLFGFYHLYLPGFLTRRPSIETQGSLFKIFLFGMLSGTAASPCLTPALAMVLALAAKAANPIEGFLTLFMFSIGMGSLLIVIGTFSGALVLLPRAGEWMVETMHLMGFAMLAMCAYFLQPVLAMNIGSALSDVITWLVYGIITLLVALYFLITSGGNIIKLLIGVALVLGALWILIPLIGSFVF